MKRLLFAFVMMIALVIVAGSAFALNDTSVLPGGLYHYRVNGISATTNATVSVDYTVGTGANISNISTTTITGGASAVSVTFDVKYGTEASPASDGVIVLTVAQDGSCSSIIKLTIDVIAAPTWTLTLTSNAIDDDYGCQQPLASPSTDGTADGTAGGTNTITFTATTGTAPAGTSSLAYSTNVSGMSATCTGCGSKTATGSFSASFPSVEGSGGTVTGTLSAATFTMDDEHGGGTYPVNVINPSLAITVSPLPTIGAFSAL